MINYVQTRPYQGRPVTNTGIRQRVRAGRTREMSAELRRLVAIVLGVSVVLVLAGSQLLHWHIQKNRQVIEQQMSVASTLTGKNINLLAQRARLMSQDQIEKVAAERLNLHVPNKEQVYRL